MDWIDLKKEQPKNYQRCLVYEDNKGGIIWDLTYNILENSNCWADPDNKGNHADWDEYFTHWMPRPENPKI